MNVLQIYLLGCLLAYPIAIDFLKMYSRASKEKNLILELQKKFEQIKPTISPNFFNNYVIAFIVLLSWIMIVVWCYFKIKLLYYTINNYIFRK